MNETQAGVIETLQATQQQLTDLLTAVAANQDWRPAPGQWSFREIAAHLATTEKECFQDRLVRICAGGKPHFEYYLNTGWDFSRFELKDSLRDWAVTRREIIDFVRGLPEEKWLLTGSHQTFGLMTVLDALKVMRDHDQEHLQELVRMLSAYNSSSS